MKETVKFTVSLNLVLLAVMTILYMVYQIGYKIAKHEQQPVIIHQVDNAGTEMFGKVTSKDVIEKMEAKEETTIELLKQAKQTHLSEMFV